MSAGFLDTLGISAEQYEQASASTVAEAFELLPSGAYPATMKSMTLYKNKFDGTMLRVEVELTDLKRTLSYRGDVGKLLKDASVKLNAAIPNARCFPICRSILEQVPA